MLFAVYSTLKTLAPSVVVQLIHVSRGVEQMDSIRFESVNPTFLLTVRKPLPAEPSS
jgi:hypothetical protein